MTRAGILHRDVSVGNILIVDDPDLDSKPRFDGFVHDFDYSSMSRDIPDAQFTNMSAAELAQRLVAEADAGTLKERTVRAAIRCVICRLLMSFILRVHTSSEHVWKTS